MKTSYQFLMKIFIFNLLLPNILWAVEVEINLAKAKESLSSVGGITFVLPKVMDASSTKTQLSNVVRIESALTSNQVSPSSRWGTGVIVGRFHQTNFNVFHTADGFLILTAYHVLLANENIEGQQLVTLFDQNRKAQVTLPFEVFGVSAGEDLALIVVGGDAIRSFDVSLPALSLVKPNDYREHTWVPSYSRMNPGLADQKDITYAELSPRERASMVTEDTVNSLAPVASSFWYIGGLFSPGMSGGPVFAHQVFDSKGVNKNELEGTLVGVMGYIFDRQTQYGYAYPITKSSLEHLFTGEKNLAYKGSIKSVSLRVLSSLMDFFPEGEFYSIETKKRAAPDGSVADELLVHIPIKSTNPVHDGFFPIMLELRQVNEFPLLSREKLLDLLRHSKPFANFGDGRNGTPGGGVIDGTPGGGVIDGSPGGGVIDGTPGSKSSKSEAPGVGLPMSSSGVSSFESVHSIAIVLYDSSGRAKTFILEKVQVNGSLQTIEYLKDLLEILKSDKQVELIVRARRLESDQQKEAQGQLNLDPLRSKLKMLKPLGELVWNAQKFKVRSVKGEHGLSLRLNTYFRDTKIGQTHQLEISLGLHLRTSTDGFVEALLSQYRIDGSDVQMPNGLRYLYKDGRLKVIWENHLILEVEL